MIKLEEKLEIDIREDKITNDPDTSYVHDFGNDDGNSDVNLVIGNLTIKMTKEQEEQLRWFYENT